MTVPGDLVELLARPEGRGVEFKSATSGFHVEDLVKYCVAIANEGGGTIVLGVTDKRPRQVVGTRAFAEPGRTETGVIERVGRGRGTRHLLSRRFHRFLGKGGAYTRRRGLDRETNKALLLRHIEDSVTAGASLGELREVLPGLSRDQVQTLLRELKLDGRVEVRGATKAARWHARPKRNSTQ